jgi:hypothetical protein
VVHISEGILAGIKKQQDDGATMKNATIALMAAVVHVADQVCFYLRYHLESITFLL